MKKLIELSKKTVFFLAIANSFLISTYNAHAGDPGCNDYALYYDCDGNCVDEPWARHYGCDGKCYKRMQASEVQCVYHCGGSWSSFIGQPGDDVPAIDQCGRCLAPSSIWFNSLPCEEETAINTPTPTATHTPIFTHTPTATPTITPTLSPTGVKIGDFIFNDLNKNGIQDKGEPGIAGVTVRLYNSTGTVLIASTLTDANGYYCFTEKDGLKSNTGFKLKLDNLSDYTQGGALFNTSLTARDQGNNDATDSDSMLVDGVPVIMGTSPSLGNSDITFDFGVVITAPVVITATPTATPIGVKCETQNIKGQLLALDSSANKLKGLINSYSKDLLKLTKNSKKIVALTKSLKIKATAAYMQAWTNIWLTPVEVSSCTGTTALCRVNNLSLNYTSFFAKTEELGKLHEVLAKEFSKLKTSAGKSKAKHIRSVVAKELKNDASMIEKLPKSSVSCS